MYGYKMCVCVCVCIYIYIYIEREREREREICCKKYGIKETTRKTYMRA